MTLAYGVPLGLGYLLPKLIRIRGARAVGVVVDVEAIINID